MPPASSAVGGVRRFFDIAVPRNISSDVNDCGASAHVYNVDDLKEVGSLMITILTSLSKFTR